MKRWITPVLSLGLAASLTVCCVQTVRARRALRILEGVHRAAVWEVSEDVQALSLSLEKAAIASTGGQEAALLSAVSRTAGDVCRLMSALPLSHAAMSPTLTFVHQLADWAQSVIPRASADGLTAEDRAALRSHLAVCRQLAAQIDLTRAEADRAGFARLSGGIFYDAPADPAARPLESLADPDHGMQYPAMIYDGAFSDARRTGTPKGLPEGQVTAEEALVIAAEAVGRDRVTAVSPAPDADGDIPAWGVTVHTGDLQLNLEITRQGGQVLWMMPETAQFPQLQGIDACRRAAADFLASQGFADMEPVSRQVYDGLCVLSFAPVQAGVVLYPDLVKVQVRMDSAEPVGLEARSYWMNHAPRDLPVPQVDEAAVRALLSGDVTVRTLRLCLIPRYGAERLCWEADCTAGDARYLIYVDASTGEEVTILKEIELNQGTVVSRQEIRRRGAKSSA